MDIVKTKQKIRIILIINWLKEFLKNLLEVFILMKSIQKIPYELLNYLT